MASAETGSGVPAVPSQGLLDSLSKQPVHDRFDLRPNALRRSRRLAVQQQLLSVDQQFLNDIFFFPQLGLKSQRQALQSLRFGIQSLSKTKNPIINVRIGLQRPRECILW